MMADKGSSSFKKVYSAVAALVVVALLALTPGMVVASVASVASVVSVASVGGGASVASRDASGDAGDVGGIGAGASDVSGAGFGSAINNGTLAASTEEFRQLIRKGLLKQKASDYTTAVALFGQAEQVAVTLVEKAQAAYFQGNAFFDAKDYKHAEQCFQRVVTYGQEQARAQAQPLAQEIGQAQAHNPAQIAAQIGDKTLAKYVSMAEIAARDCSSCINPLNDFPTGMYLWIKSNMGTAVLASVDRYFNVWDNIKIYLYIIILLIVLLRVLIKIRRRKTKKAGTG